MFPEWETLLLTLRQFVLKLLPTTLIHTVSEGLFQCAFGIYNLRRNSDQHGATNEWKLHQI